MKSKILFLVVLMFMLCGTGYAQTVFSDNFQRANANPLAAPWEGIGGSFQLLSGVVEPQYGFSNGYGAAYMYYSYNNDTVFTDQFSQTTVGHLMTSAHNYEGPLVRMNSSYNWYGLAVYGPLGSGATVALYSYKGGNLVAPKTVPVNQGDVLKITAVGNVITGYVNGTQVLQATDSTISSGWFGMSAYADNIASDVQITAWSGGPLNSSPAAPGGLMFSALAVCSSKLEGTLQAVSDSTTNTWGATISGGGSAHVLAYCDGTNWTVAGK